MIVEPDRFTKWVQVVAGAMVAIRMLVRWLPGGWLGAIGAAFAVAIVGIITWGKMRPRSRGA